MAHILRNYNMAKIKWHRIAENALIRKHGHEIVQSEYTQKVQKKQANKNFINLGIHEKHNWQPLKGPFGPHAGKIICKTCQDKWVAWLPKGTI